jgi:hypothetical protein
MTPEILPRFYRGHHAQVTLAFLQIARRPALSFTCQVREICPGAVTACRLTYARLIRTYNKAHPHEQG